MAIFVSNTANPVFSPNLSEAIDPNLPGLETAFTEELAAVRRPQDADADAAVSAPSLKEDEKEDDTGDLQILPANVLINAVTDANFAYALQGQVAQPVVPVPVPVPVDGAGAGSATPEITADPSVAAAGLSAVGTVGAANGSGSAGQALQDLQDLQAEQASQATANPELNLALPVNPQGTAAHLENASLPTLAAFEVQTPMAAVAAEDAKAALLKANGPWVAEPTQKDEQSADSVTMAAVQLGQVNQGAQGTQGTQGAQAFQTAQATPPNQATQSIQAVQTLQPSQLASVDSTLSTAIQSTPTADALSTAAMATAEAQTPVNLSSASADSNTAVKVLSASTGVANMTSDSAQDLAQASSLVKSDVPSLLPQSTLTAPEIQTSANALSLANSALASSVQASSPKVATANADSPKSSDTSASIDVGVTKSSSLSFDAHLGSGKVNSAAKELASSMVNDTGMAANFASEPSFETVQQQAKLDSVSGPFTQEPIESKASAPKSLEDLSASFVSSLVGGAPRPTATVMDMTALQSQDKTTSVTPHEARLDAGSIHSEIQRMVKQGGGHVVMEITPPDQSKFTIELKMDTQGNARLIVEGVSDSTRTRLEQSAPQLREQFQQMGMALQLDMRQQRDNGSQSAPNQDAASERSSWMAQQPDIQLPEQRASAASRALASGANQVYLYA